MSANSIGKYFRVNGSTLAQQYKDYLSGFWKWDQIEHAEDWILFPTNLGEVTCIDEVALSDGELYTVVSNARARCQKGSLVAMIKGVRSVEVSDTCFPKASIVSDRFHVQQLPSEALQEMRIKYRWEAIEEENNLVKQVREKGQLYQPEILSNGDTKKQLLARSRYLLYKPSNKWTSSQAERGCYTLFNLSRSEERL